MVSIPKCISDRGSAPVAGGPLGGGAYSAPQTLVSFKGTASWRRKGEGKEGREKVEEREMKEKGENIPEINSCSDRVFLRGGRGAEGLRWGVGSDIPSPSGKVLWRRLGSFTENILTQNGNFGCTPKLCCKTELFVYYNGPSHSSNYTTAVDIFLTHNTYYDTTDTRDTLNTYYIGVQCRDSKITEQSTGVQNKSSLLVTISNSPHSQKLYCVSVAVSYCVALNVHCAVQVPVMPSGPRRLRGTTWGVAHLLFR